MISDIGSQLTLIDELDARQNEVLDQLDKLNGRLELLLGEYTSRWVTPADPDAPTCQSPSADAAPAAPPQHNR